MRKCLLPLVIFISSISFNQRASGQFVEKVFFDARDSATGYYLAIPPRSNLIKATLVVFSSFYQLEDIITQTKLHNVTYGNDMLTVYATLKESFYADTSTIDRINTILNHLTKKYSADTSAFVFAGFQVPGNSIVRYTELTYEHPTKFPIRPKAFFGVDCTVDLFGLWHWSERQIKKNYNADDIGSAKYILENLTKNNGTIVNNPGRYKMLSPLNREIESVGNEKFLKDVAVRLYYDTDINWQLQHKRAGFYDTNIPDGSELISRLLLLGNENAEFMVARQPGMRSNGIRNPSALSIVDEVDCIQWIRRTLGIIDLQTWKPPYTLIIPNGWEVERFGIPIEFAPQIPYKGVEEIRFAPGWGDTASEQHWTYAFLWWLDGKVKLDAATLQNYLTGYYAGLVGRNIISRNIPPEKVIPTKATIKKEKTSTGDLETYSGTINMLNYFTQTPIVLNCSIHIKNCDAQNNTGVFIEISPRNSGHAVWKELNRIGNSFKCNN
ncbi:MAG TPA: hypothetical protein VM012_03325 [Flavitalea sp.]|nr:hypothetical protein [Flavitalea sp.]